MWGENWSSKTIDLGRCCANLISWRSRGTPAWRLRACYELVELNVYLLMFTRGSEGTRAFAYCDRKRLRTSSRCLDPRVSFFRLPSLTADFLTSTSCKQTRTALDHKLAYHGQFRGEHSRSNIRTNNNRPLPFKLLCCSEQGQAHRRRAVTQANVSI